MGVVPPGSDFLVKLRSLTRKYGIVLIFDEIITGFRVAYGGAQAFYNITPDLTCLGKIIGGGLPVGAYGGKKEIMEHIAPLGAVYQAGTLSGNPLAMTAGYHTLKILARGDIYKSLEDKAQVLIRAFKDNADSAGVKVSTNIAGCISCLFFTDKEVVDYESAVSSDTEKYAFYFSRMQAEGIYLPPSQFEALFLSASHTSSDIEKTITANKKVMDELAQKFS